MLFPMNISIWFHPKPVDFRRQLDGLVILIADHLNHDPSSGQLFLFRDKSGKKIKIVWWDRNGFWLLYKRFEKGRLTFPTSEEEALALTADQFSWLMSGLDCMKHTSLPTVNASHFY